MAKERELKEAVSEEVPEGVKRFQVIIRGVGMLAVESKIDLLHKWIIAVDMAHEWSKPANLLAPPVPWAPNPWYGPFILDSHDGNRYAAIMLHEIMGVVAL